MHAHARGEDPPEKDHHVPDGVARGYSWPPFEKGHELSLRHGAYSPRLVNPVAQALVDGALADDDLAFLRAPCHRFALNAWARAEARVQLLTAYLEKMGSVEEAITDREESESEEVHSKGRSKRISKSKRVAAALEMLDRAETRAEKTRTRLGMDPLSRARLGRDVVAARVDFAQWLSAEDRKQDEVEDGDG